MTHVDSDPTAAQVAETDIIEPEALTYEEMYQQYRPGLLNRAKGLGVSDPEGAVQDVFLRAWRQLNERDDEVVLHKSWFFTTLRNIAIDEFRYNKRRHADESAWDVDEVAKLPDQFAGAAFRAIELDEIMSRINRVLDEAEKPDHWYHIVARRALRDDQYNEIGEELAIPVTSVASSLHRARKTLMDDPELAAMLNRE